MSFLLLLSSESFNKTVKAVILLVAGEGFDFALLCRTGTHSLRSPAFCCPPFVCSEPTFSSVQLLATHISQKSHHKGDFSVLLVAGEGFDFALLCRTGTH